MEKTANDITETPLILVVDDEQVVLKATEANLKHMKYRVAIAHNGSEGLAEAIRLEPDLILTDINMPVMDGWSMVRHIRIQKQLSFTPIIFMSQLEGPEERSKAFQIGGDDFISKEFLRQELPFRVEKALTTSRLQRRLAELEVGRIDYLTVFSGRLDDFNLTSLISLCRTERNTGLLVVNLKDTRDSGLIYFSEGEVVSAKTVGSVILKNDAALTHILKWTAGTFEMQRLEPAKIGREIDEPTDRILRTATARLDHLI